MRWCLRAAGLTLLLLCGAAAAEVIEVPADATFPMRFPDCVGDTYDFGDVDRVVPASLPVPIDFPGAADCTVKGLRLIEDCDPTSVPARWRLRKATRAEVQDRPNVTGRCADNDGVRFSHATGEVSVIGGYFWGVMDPIAPPKEPDTSRDAKCRVEGVHFEWINDDVIENDAALDCAVEDVLVEGARVFVSARPNAGVQDSFPPAVVQVRDSVIGLGCLPDNRADGRDMPPDWGGPEPGPYDSCGPDHSVSMIWKWSRNADQLTVDVRDTIFMVPDAGRNGRKSMDFPNGTYENVTLVWGGADDYPGREPPEGVTLTTDMSVYERAVADWKARHKAK